MTQKIRPVRILDDKTLMRGFKTRKDDGITIEEERAKMKAFFKKESKEKIFIPQTE